MSINDVSRWESLLCHPTVRFSAVIKSIHSHSRAYTRNTSLLSCSSSSNLARLRNHKWQISKKKERTLYNQKWARSSKKVKTCQVVNSNRSQREEKISRFSRSHGTWDKIIRRHLRKFRIWSSGTPFNTTWSSSVLKNVRRSSSRRDLRRWKSTSACKASTLSRRNSWRCGRCGSPASSRGNTSPKWQSLALVS